MTAREIIKELQQVNPDAEVTITTDNGQKEIIRVVRMGYSEPVTLLGY